MNSEQESRSSDGEGPDRSGSGGDASTTSILIWFVHNHVAANLLMLFLIGGGLVALMNMRTETFPSVDPRLVTVTVPFPGATPYEVEDGITSRVEEALLGINGVKRITSVAKEGVGTVKVELEEFADANDVRNEVETEVQRLADFPPEDAEDPVVVKQKPQPGVITLILYGDVEEKVIKYWAEKIENDLIRVGAASLIDVQGARDYEISIAVSEEKLRKHSLTIHEIADLTGAFSQNIPAGTIESESGDILLRVNEKGEVGSDFENIVIRSETEGGFLRLKDIAEIRDDFVDLNLISLYNGKPSVFIQISRSEAQDTLEIEKQVYGYLSSLALPAGLEIEVWHSETESLKDRINLLLRNGIMGFCLVFIVLFLFLDLKLAFWTSLGVPISFMGGLMMCYYMGYSINMVTLFALILVLGIVVDDAIVTGESIFATQHEGYKNEKAAILGLKRIIAPVGIGVLTTIAAFLPLAFVTGVLGQILRVIPPFVISILVISLIEAFLILPAHLSNSNRWSLGPLLWLRHKITRGLEFFVNKVLTPFLEIALSLRYISMAVFAAILILAAGTFAGGLIKFVFFPPIDGEEVTIDLTMPVGTPYDVTKQYAQEILRAVQEVRQEINAENGVVSMREAQRSSSAGTTGGEEKENRQQGEKPQGEERGGAARLRFPLGGASVQEDVYKATLFMVGRTITQANPVDSGGEASSNNRAQIRIKLAESDKRNVTSLDIERRVREKIGAIPGADELTFESSLIQAGPDVTVELSHPDPDILVGAADRLKKDLSSSPGVVEVTSSLKPGKREYLFRLKPAGLAAGLTPAGLGRQLRNSFYGNEVQRINRDGSELKVMVRYPELQREKLKTIHKMRVDLPDGSKAPLSAVAEIIQQKGFSTIQRADGQRIARLTADVDKAVVTPNETISLVFNQLVPVLQEEFPSLTASLEGESKDRQEDLAIMGRNMIISLMLIFVLLGTLLKSYVQPIIILAIIPFGMIGAVIGHVLLGYTLSFISTFGIVALTGVIVNNSVVMIDYYNTRLREGAGFDAAIIEAVQRRFRPILLTTLTTSMGLLPILIEDSLQARFLIPMAISLAFGLIFGTLILLILLPVLIAVVEDLRRIPARIISYVRLETGYSSGHKS